MSNIDCQQSESLHDTISNIINNYLDSVDSVDTKELTNLHEIYIAEIEPPLLESTLKRARFNQLKAAKILGIARGTFRKKLKHYFDDKYCTTRNDYETRPVEIEKTSND